MKYLVITTNIRANYTLNGVQVRIDQISDNAVVRGPGLVLTDISAYTPLPAYVAQQAALLQSAKNNAIASTEAASQSALASGVTVTVAGVGTLVLSAGTSEVNLFAQGTVLILAVQSQAPDLTAFQTTMISTIFGRGLTDITGQSHDMTVFQFQQVAVVYGQAVSAAQTQVAATVAQINACTTVADVKAIVTAS